MSFFQRKTNKRIEVKIDVFYKDISLEKKLHKIKFRLKEIIFLKKGCGPGISL